MKIKVYFVVVVVFFLQSFTVKAELLSEQIDIISRQSYLTEYGDSPGVVYLKYDDFDLNGTKELFVIEYENRKMLARMYDDNGLIDEYMLDFGVGTSPTSYLDIGNGKSGIYLKVHREKIMDNVWRDVGDDLAQYIKFKDGKFFLETTLEQNYKQYHFDEFSAVTEDRDLSSEVSTEAWAKYNNGKYNENTYTEYWSSINNKEVSLSEYNELKSIYDAVEWTTVVNGIEPPSEKEIEENVNETAILISTPVIKETNLPDFGENLLEKMDEVQLKEMLTWISYSEGLTHMNRLPYKYDNVSDEQLGSLIVSPRGFPQKLTDKYGSENNYSAQQVDRLLTGYIGKTISNPEAAGVELKDGRYYFMIDFDFGASYLPMYEVKGVYALNEKDYIVTFNLHNAFSPEVGLNVPTEVFESLKNVPVFESYNLLTDEMKRAIPPAPLHYAIIAQTDDTEVPWKLLERASAEDFKTVEPYKTQPDEEENTVSNKEKADNGEKSSKDSSIWVIGALAVIGLIAGIIVLLRKKRKG